MNRGYKQEAINRRIHQINAIGHESLLVKYSKQNKIEILVLELISYPALEIVHEILLKAHLRHAYSSLRLKHVLPTHPGFAYQIDNSLKDKLVRSKIRNLNKRNQKIYI